MDFTEETEIPGKQLDRVQYQMIFSRYFHVYNFCDENSTVLEVGCGPGLGIGYLLEKIKSYIGIDNNQKALDFAINYYGDKKGLELIKHDAHDLGIFTDNQFDFIFAMQVIFYLNMEIFIPRIKRILKPGGRFLFSIPNKEVPGFRPSKLSRNYFSPKEIEGMFNRHGFQIQLFGAFPISSRSKLISRSFLTRWGGKALDIIGFGKKSSLRKFLNRKIYKKNFVLNNEMKKGIVPPCSLMEINADSEYKGFRIFYILGSFSN